MEQFKETDELKVTFREEDTYGYICKVGKFKQINELGVFLEDSAGETIFVPMFNISSIVSFKRGYSLNK